MAWYATGAEPIQSQSPETGALRFVGPGKMPLMLLRCCLRGLPPMPKSQRDQYRSSSSRVSALATPVWRGWHGRRDERVRLDELRRDGVRPHCQWSRFSPPTGIFVHRKCRGRPGVRIGSRGPGVRVWFPLISAITPMLVSRCLVVRLVETFRFRLHVPALIVFQRRLD
jgi:hypothetical protein